MRKVLIANEILYGDVSSGTLSDIDDANLLKEGAIAFFNEAGTLIPHDDTGTVLDAGGSKYITMCLGLGSGKVLSINRIRRDTFEYNPIAISDMARVVAVNKVMFIGGDGSSSVYNLNLPTLANGDEAVIRVYNKTTTDNWDTYYEYRTPLVAADTDATTATKVAAKINADANRIVDAVAITTSGKEGVQLTSKDGLNFTANPAGVLEDADKLEYKMVNNVYTSGYTTATAHVTGKGTYTQVQAAEEEMNVSRGKGNYQNDGNGEMYTESNLASSTVVYSQINATYREKDWQLMHADGYTNDLTIYFNPARSGSPSVQDLYIAIPALLDQF